MRAGNDPRRFPGGGRFTSGYGTSPARHVMIVPNGERRAMANIGKGRALQVCDACGIVDDSPRHHFGGGVSDAYPRPTPLMVRKVTEQVANLDEADADRLVAELLDTGTVSLHLDCCRARGCPTGECTARTAGNHDARGATLLKHLERLAKGSSS